MPRKKKQPKQKKKCCNNCQYMVFDKKAGHPDCTHPDSQFGEKENCKNMRHDFSCKNYSEKEGDADEPPAIQMFQMQDDNADIDKGIEELKEKDVDIYMVSGAMYTAKIVSYNTMYLTFVRLYSNERFTYPRSEIKCIIVPKKQNG